MRVLVTGSREWPDAHDGIIIAVINGYENGYELEYRERLTVVVGDCATGVDKIVRNRYPDLVEIHAADWQKHGRAAGPIRNQAMVNSGVDLCLAFFHQQRTAGTDHCANTAARAGSPVYEIWTRK